MGSHLKALVYRGAPGSRRQIKLLTDLVSLNREPAVLAPLHDPPGSRRPRSNSLAKPSFIPAQCQARRLAAPGAGGGVAMTASRLSSAGPPILYHSAIKSDVSVGQQGLPAAGVIGGRCALVWWEPSLGVVEQVRESRVALTVNETGHLSRICPSCRLAAWLPAEPEVTRAPRWRGHVGLESK